MIGKEKSIKTIHKRAQVLEGAYFLERDKNLVERHRQMKEMAETREALAAVSGIKNEVILNRLVELNVKPEIVAALATIPLIEIAWADGKLDSEEKKAVLSHVSEQGIKAGSLEYDIIESWLTNRPDRKLLSAWQAYIKGLCEELSEDERKILKDELLRCTRAIAEASGGFLGLGKISFGEQKMLKKLEDSF